MNEIPRGSPIRVWDEPLMKLAEELAKDLQETRALYRKAREEREYWR